jgi:hypothetical protein
VSRRDERASAAVGDGRGEAKRASAIDAPPREMWRAPPLAKLSRSNQAWMAALRAYLVLAAGVALIRIVLLATDCG